MTMEKGKKRYSIEGKLRVPEKADITKLQLTVFAFIENNEIGQSKVAKDGSFSIDFSYSGDKPNVELKLLPSKLSRLAAKFPGMKQIVDKRRFKTKKMSEEREYTFIELILPYEYIAQLFILVTTYRIHGVVYIEHPGPWLEALSCAKIEFFEIDLPFMTPPLLFGSEVNLGYTYTAPDGSYEFDFDFTYPNYFSGTAMWLFSDRKPDIQARISQFIDGDWVQIYKGPVDWDIQPDFHRDYFIPEDMVTLNPASTAKPAQGFEYTSIGLLPIDVTRIVGGYAYAQPGDPSRIESIYRQPFCGTLRIFGLFAAAPQVETYDVQFTEADVNGSINNNWRDIEDSLENRFWNGAAWEHRNLGPDANGRYTNIDIQPEYDWHEHSLKATWKSANLPNGFYILRIRGYNAGNVEVCSVLMPVLRIDNTVPMIEFDVEGQQNICGHITLPSTRTLMFRVTAYDPEGHLLRYHLSGLRGRDSESAGPTVQFLRPDPNNPYFGINDRPVAFEVSTLQGILQQCNILAYNFELHVYGSSTDCYTVTPSSQHISDQINLVLSEPS